MGRFRKVALIGAVVAVPVVASGFLLQSRKAQEGTVLLEQVFQLVANRYVDTLQDSQIFEKAAKGLVRELNDPYSELLAPRDVKQFNSKTGGRYAGLGMLIGPASTPGGYVIVQKVYRNSPAERGGVRVGDRITRADTMSTAGWDISKVSDFLTGDPNTKVNATFQRPGVATPINLTFTRAVIHVPAVPYTLVFDNKIGYLPLEAFNENSAEETTDAIKKLEAQGVSGIIVDLRGNPGGILDQSVDIGKLFLKKGQRILSQRGRVDSVDYDADGQPLLPQSVPLVVMTNGGTASAAEIVAGALQDHDRALVLGETSFGKGLVQSVYTLDGGYALKITTAKWFTPSGRSIQRERKIVDGQFVPEEPDTNVTEATKKKRPAYKSDMGRTVYGGGGITPDLIVDGDTLTTAELQYLRTTAPKASDIANVEYDYTLELANQVKRGFSIDPAWRDEYYRRIQAAGATVDRSMFNAAQRYIDRNIEQRVSSLAEGDSTARRRDLKYDAQLRQAIAILEKAKDQRDLFSIATAMAPAAKPAKP